jgi:CsoR family transcriptional regulator, copper-sensing transcriptional repressor
MLIHCCCQRAFPADQVIYAEVDPETGEIRYIGRTSRPQRRHAQHLQDASSTAAHWGSGKKVWYTRRNRIQALISCVNKVDYLSLTHPRGVWYNESNQLAAMLAASRKEREMQEDRRQEVLKRLSYIEGHVAGIRKMVEEDKYCVDILRQTYAVRKALEKLEKIVLEGHLHTCVPEGIRGNREEAVIQELVQLYDIAGNR